MLVAAPFAGGVVEVAAAGLMGAGAALLPDLDHPGSTATRSQGPATRWVSTGVRALSRAAWRATATKYDRGGRERQGEHRHLTHTVPAAVAVGVASGGAAAWWPAQAVLLWALVSLGLRGIGLCLTGRDRRELSQWTTVSIGAALIVAVVMAVAPPQPGLLGAVVAVGMVVHSIGDGLTTAGVPLLWPVRVHGQRWLMVGSPRLLRWDAGVCWQERCVQVVCGLGAPVALVLFA